MTVKFEGQDRREATLKKVLPEYGFKNLEEARDLCLSKGIDVDAIVKGIQPIAFDNASTIVPSCSIAACFAIIKIFVLLNVKLLRMKIKLCFIFSSNFVPSLSDKNHN